MLFATYMRQPTIGEDLLWYHAVKLDADGNITKMLGGAWHGHNSAIGLRQLAATDFIMLMQLNFFMTDGHVRAVFCTATGVLFGFDDF